MIEISANLNHEVAGLTNEGAITINEKNVKKAMLENTKSEYNERCIMISKIKKHDVKFINRIIASKICLISREDDMVARFIHASYKICIEN